MLSLAYISKSINFKLCLHHLFQVSSYYLFTKTKQTNVKDNQQVLLQVNQKTDQVELNEKQKITFMEKTYEQVQLKSFLGRRFTNLTQFQKNIIQTNKFDLMASEIKPKIINLNSIPGLQFKPEITSISLGKIQVKNENQVYLSELDPYNIPQDYQIRFDTHKQLSLVGKKVKKNQSAELANASPSKMSISTAESFQQKTLGELSEKYMGQIGYKYQFNRKRSFKQFLLLLPIIYILLDPILTTFNQIWDCLQSIKEIEEEEIKEINKIKKQRMVQVILDNKDFNVII